jgi:hypothetical protein
MLLLEVLSLLFIEEARKLVENVSSN